MMNSLIALGTAVLFPKHNFKLYELDDFCIGNDTLERFARHSVLWLVYCSFWKDCCTSTLFLLSVFSQYMQ